MTTAEILQVARAKIEYEHAWARGASAQDEHGARVACNDTAAVRWCVTGALCAASYYDWADALRACNAAIPPEWRKRPLDPLVDDPYRDTIARWNDDPATTHAHVLELFDRAIADASRRGDQRRKKEGA